ncbi:GNAT family N-acetyltransferase [Ruminococcus sp.]|uniref:GNAT family N-acetyltransferase n=1 Tax=Ruminococcus sp. TaxID=41978 RepID=UPI002E81019C|nr:GNAT family N-acetyltransferase [Ruminococcus sp.]MEE3492545.1 GNAT family N-acetyltransferase [Ruminococcus sp.]
MKFKNYNNSDYEAVCDFLIGLNRENQNHINWNWGRFEWMMEHPEFDKSLMNSIGLWMDGDKVVGAAIYDMYFGEAFVGALPAYSALYPEILDYAYCELKDENGLGVAVCDTCTDEISMAKSAGFTLAEQTETVMRIDLDKELPANLPDGLRYAELDPVKEPYDFQWLLWQGFDHGTDKAEFEKQEQIIPQNRPHLNPSLSIAVENADGEKVAYCCLWYSEKTDYAYVEPVCTVPAYRGKGIAKAVIDEALNRARTLGAKKAYVLSDMLFYEKLGFREDRRFTFLWKK